MRDRGGASHPIVELTLTRLREFLREPEAVFWLVFFPILIAFALGIAFRGKGEEVVHAGVIAGEDAAGLRSALSGAPGIRVHELARNRADLALRDGEVQVIVLAGTPPTYRFDPTRPESRLARLAVDAALQKAGGRVDQFQAGEQRIEIAGSRYIDWLIPGLLGMNIMGTGMWGIGFSIVHARSRRVLKRLAATPMARSDFLLAQMLARLVFLGLEVGALLLFAWLMFQVPMKGAVVTLAGVTLLGALSFAGLGLLIASRAKTIEAVSGLMNFAMVPMWVLSGVFFSSANFPPATQPFIHALPLTALNDALRAVMLDGAPAVAIAPQLLVMTAWTLVSFAIALRIFRWR